MDVATIIAIGVIFLAIILGQRIVVNQHEKLSDEMRLAVSKAFVRSNSNYSIAIFSIVFVFVIVAYSLPAYLNWLIGGYFLIIGSFFIGKIVVNTRKLKAINAPWEYIRAVYLSYLLLIGSAVLAGIILGLGNSGLFR
ncbi:MAG: hypothetical protein KF831_08730 [Acidobacteria bacterium]|nr:hypothetical protein [Acidobacteriota bacterium]